MSYEVEDWNLPSPPVQGQFLDRLCILSKEYFNHIDNLFTIKPSVYDVPRLLSLALFGGFGGVIFKEPL